MQEIKFYRTCSFGGSEGRDMIDRYFETEEDARENALHDTWNADFSLYEVTMTIDKTVSFSQNFIARIPCPRDSAYRDVWQNIRAAYEEETKMKR